jgi:protein SCO1/2
MNPAHADGSDHAVIGRSTGWRALIRSPFFWGALAGIVLIPAIRPLTRHVPDPPPVIGTIPPFEALDQDGRPSGSEALRNHVYLASFLGTSDADAESARVATLVRLQRRCRRMGVRLRLVTLPRGPDRDAPEALRKVIVQAGGDLSGHTGDGDSGPGSWTVANLPETENATRVVQSFLSFARPGPAAPPTAVPAEAPAALADRAVLVDGDGGVRGAFTVDDAGMDEVFHRSQHVMSLRRGWR